tara:strand:+ start:16347 stop:16745 length:399 start_codon:yes stop_codon:yes gene_type:complete
MSINESKLWKRIKVAQKPYPDWFLFRLESNTINGIPDVYGCIRNTSFWLELKCSNAKDKGLSKFQWNWHIDYLRSGGKSFILNYHATQSKLELLAIHEPRDLHQVQEWTFGQEPGSLELEARVHDALVLIAS